MNGSKKSSVFATNRTNSGLEMKIDDRKAKNNQWCCAKSKLVFEHIKIDGVFAYVNMKPYNVHCLTEK